MATPAIANSLGEYHMIMDDFKEAHKEYQKVLKENSQLRELRSDIEIIEMEKENGTKTCLQTMNNDLKEKKIINLIFKREDISNYKCLTCYGCFCLFLLFSEEKDRPHTVTFR